MAGKLEHLIHSVTLPGAGVISITGLIVVVGPNSSGKTQFLRDLAQRQGGADDLVVCKQIAIKKPDNLSTLVDALEAKRLIYRPQVEQNQQQPLIVRTSQIGARQPLKTSVLHLMQVDEWHKNFSQPRHAELFAGAFAPLLTATLFLENRLEITKAVKGYDYEKHAPQSEIHELHMRSAAQDQLNQEIWDVFGKGIGVNTSRNSEWTLSATDEYSQRAPVIRPDESEKYRNLEEEGDGLRSYVAICMTLLAGFRPLCLIDEPELCLHPPQAYAMGKFIGRHATAHGHTTIVATHSSQVLRGVVETTPTLRILRMSRHEGKFLVHEVDANTIGTLIKRPGIRADEVLDGIFSDGVALVESDNDRVVYETAGQQCKDTEHFDTSFIALGGAGGLSLTARFYRHLHIPTAIVADLDRLMEPMTVFKPLLESLGCTQPDVEGIAARCEKLQDAIRALPPTVDIEDVRREMSENVVVPASWSGDNDVTLANALRALACKLERARRIKRGIAAFDDHPEIVADLKMLVEECAKRGLFLIPVGELECWKPASPDFDPNTDKAGHATETVSWIKTSPVEAVNVTDFISQVRTYLKSQRNIAFR